MRAKLTGVTACSSNENCGLAQALGHDMRGGEDGGIMGTGQEVKVISLSPSGAPGSVVETQVPRSKYEW